MRTWAPKDPDEVLDYRVRWGPDSTARVPALQTGETITSSTFIVDQGTVVIDSHSVDGTDTVLWLSGGTLNELCLITNRITTSMGRTYDETMRLRIRSK